MLSAPSTRAAQWNRPQKTLSARGSLSPASAQLVTGVTNGRFLTLFSNGGECLSPGRKYFVVKKQMGFPFEDLHHIFTCLAQ